MIRVDQKKADSWLRPDSQEGRTHEVYVVQEEESYLGAKRETESVQVDPQR